MNFYHGVVPTALSLKERDVLLANMDAMKALERLRDKGPELTPEGVRSLVLQATADEDAADEAYADRVIAYEKSMGN